MKQIKPFGRSPTTPRSCFGFADKPIDGVDIATVFCFKKKMQRCKMIFSNSQNLRSTLLFCSFVALFSICQDFFFETLFRTPVVVVVVIVVDDDASGLHNICINKRIFKKNQIKCTLFHRHLHLHHVQETIDFFKLKTQHLFQQIKYHNYRYQSRRY